MMGRMEEVEEACVNIIMLCLYSLDYCYATTCSECISISCISSLAIPVQLTMPGKCGSHSFMHVLG